MERKAIPTPVPGDPASYPERVALFVPGLADMHRLAGLLLAERVPDAGRVLVLGAGGGVELRAFARAHAGWRFDGVDPSAEMLAAARRTLGADAARVTFHHGVIDDAPAGPFDGATSLLVLHFLPRAERLRTLRELHRRLHPGAPLVVVHYSFPLAGGEHDLWLRRNAAWLMSGGVPEAQALAGMAALKVQLPVMSPDEDAALLVEAGFSRVQLFYAAFALKGWAARA